MQDLGSTNRLGPRNSASSHDHPRWSAWCRMATVQLGRNAVGGRCAGPTQRRDQAETSHEGAGGLSGGKRARGSPMIQLLKIW